MAAAGVALYDGVVVDAARSTAYVMHPGGGIAAYDLERGVALWRSSAGERPLLLAGDLLVAQARPDDHGELRIVALDIRKGGAASAEADIPLPSGVRAEVVDTLKQASTSPPGRRRRGSSSPGRFRIARTFPGGLPTCSKRGQLANRRAGSPEVSGSKWAEQPLCLRAVDLTTGRELWSWEIRDPAFRGPFPL